MHFKCTHSLYIVTDSQVLQLGMLFCPLYIYLIDRVLLHYSFTTGHFPSPLFTLRLSSRFGYGCCPIGWVWFQRHILKLEVDTFQIDHIIIR